MTIQDINELSFKNGIVHIDNKESLQKIMADYQNNDVNQVKFNEVIKSLQDSGFKPLNPIFSEGDTKAIELFLKRKKQRIQVQKSNIYNKINVADTANIVLNGNEEIEIEDNIIHDPAFSSLLNEDREIVVSDILYKYTDFGLFYCEESKKEYLIDFILKLSEEEKNALIGLDRLSPDNCEYLPEVKKRINKDINYFLPEKKSTCVDESTSRFSKNNNSKLTAKEFNVSSTPLSDIAKQNFPITTIEKRGLWQQFFGASTESITPLRDRKRVVVQFWNQNYFIFSSIGCKVKTQKYVRGWFFSWWEKTYVNKLELGLNYMEYSYKHNVPAYNYAKYQNETTFFECNGVKYNIWGGVINTVPTGIGTFNFDFSNAQTGIKIFIAGYEVTNQNINQVTDLALTTVANKTQGLLQKANDGLIKYEIVNARPFSDRVKFSVAKVNWQSYDASQITHYFDFNFKLSYNSNYEKTLDYLSGLNGATTYGDVKIDMYAAAYHNGEWSGSRLKQDK